MVLMGPIQPSDRTAVRFHVVRSATVIVSTCCWKHDVTTVSSACLFERLRAIQVSETASPHEASKNQQIQSNKEIKRTEKKTELDQWVTRRRCHGGEAVSIAGSCGRAARGHAVDAEPALLRVGGEGGRCAAAGEAAAAAAPGDPDPRRRREPAGGEADGGVQPVEPRVPGVARGAWPRRLVPAVVRPVRPGGAADKVLRRPDDALLRPQRRRLPQRSRRRDQGLRLRLHFHPPLPRPQPQVADRVHERVGEHAGEGRVRGGVRPVRRAVRLPVRAGRAGAPVAGGQRVPGAAEEAGGVGARGQRRQAGDPRGAQPGRAVRATGAGAQHAGVARGEREAAGDAVRAMGRVGAGDAHLRLRQHPRRAVRRRVAHPRRAADRREQPLAAAGAPGVRQHHAGGVAVPQPVLLRQEHDAVPAGHRVRRGGGAVPRADTAARRGPAGAGRAGDLPRRHRRRHRGEPRVWGGRLRGRARGGCVRRRRRDGQPRQPRRADQGVVGLAGAGGGGGRAAQGVALRHPQGQERPRPDLEGHRRHQSECHELRPSIVAGCFVLVNYWLEHLLLLIVENLQYAS